jgi:hypothetical protein
VSWINDGLLVMRRGEPTAPIGQVYRIDTKTGHQEPWKNILSDHVGLLNRPWLRVTPDGQSYAYTWHRALSSLYIADGLV